MREEELLNAVCDNDPAVVNQLVDDGAKPDYAIQDGNTLLHIAAARGDVETGRIFVDVGTNVDAQNGAGETPLILATKQNRPDFVRMLLENGATLNMQDHLGNTALFYAMERGFAGIAQQLEIAGACH